MKKILLFAVILFGSLVSSGQATDNCSKVPSITVSGTARMELVPDEIFLTVCLTEKDRTDKKELNEIESMFLGVLDKLHISREDLSLSDANSSLIRVPWKGKKISKSKLYNVRVKDVSTLTSLVDELEEMDISNVNVSHVDHSKIEDYWKEVKIKAIIAAKDKAGYLLKAIGEELGDALEITENYYIPQSVQSNVMASNLSIRGSRPDGTMNASDDTVSFEKIILEYSITAKFRIKAGAEAGK